MEKQPQFIKEFSKKESPEDRQIAAKNIKAKRVDYFSKKNIQIEKQKELQQSDSERERVLSEQLEVINKLNNKIAELSEFGLKKFLNYFQLKKIRADIVVGKKTYKELKQKHDEEVMDGQKTYEELDEETQLSLQETKRILDCFYEEQKSKWEQSEYTKEDVIKYFSEEYLSSLSIEDYALLVKRFPSEMVTHVTRQGVRDHVGHVFHTAGQGAYSDNFKKIVEDGRLRSSLGVYLVEEEKEQAIAKFLELDTFKNKEEALNYLDTFTTQKIEKGSYADRMAIHFATEEVADSYYGSEQGNEIFIAYPAMHIASQYYFFGQLSESGGGYWNDQWVWANEDHGMDLNAGLVFIPEEAKVDRQTGSRYVLDKNRNPLINIEYKEAIKKVVDSSDFFGFANQVIETNNKFDQNQNNHNFSNEDRDLLNKLEPYYQRLENEFGITDKRLQSIILDPSNLWSFISSKKILDSGNAISSDIVNETVEHSLKKNNALFLEAKDTISSKDYWDEYFAKNSEKRPSKIVYYKGEDPTSALLKWKKENGVNRFGDRVKYNKQNNFPKQHIVETEKKATAGVIRFRSLAEKVIDSYFSQKEK